MTNSRPTPAVGCTVERITGGLLAAGDGGTTGTSVVIVDGRIDSLRPAPPAGVPLASGTLDAGDLVVSPGLIDVQINGGWGHDFTSDPTSIAAVARRLPETGVTSFVPTIVSSTRRRRDAARRAWTELEPDPLAARPLGLHFEGPLLNPARAGAHDPAHIGPLDLDEIEGWSPDAGVVLVTVAPEQPGALDVIRLLTDQGVTVSIGHTNATAEQVVAAIDAGARGVTHLFNAMAPFDHRAPGPIGATFARTDLSAGLICDGIHVDPEAVRMAWAALGGRLHLVSDATAALGSTGSSATLAGLDVTIGDDGVRLANGVLAGSNLRLDQAVRNLVAFTGCAPDEALRAASGAPAALLGRADLGRVDAGAPADVVLFDENLTVRTTIIGGRVVWPN